MNNRRKWVVWSLIFLVLSVILVACASNQATEETVGDTPTVVKTEQPETPTETPEVALPEFPEPNELSSVAPIMLEGAETTESGLQYLELAAGDGPAPQPGELVTMHFIGTLPDGTEFANSVDGGEPFTTVFGRGQLLPGWEEGLALMKVGGTSQMVLPPELAFGEQGYGMIPPNSQIILEVELLSAETPPQPTSVSEDDLTTTDSGLQYFDIKEGTGTGAALNSTVTTHFTMWVQTEDGEEYVLSSVGGDPLSFVVGRGDTVFPGWEEGMLDMKAGGYRLLVIPPDLAFGEMGANSIPPNSTLVMEVELVELREPVAMTEVNEEDYTTSETGLKYFDIVEGEGDSPSEGQTVVVHYTGWLENGQQFDSSVDRGSPFSFVLGEQAVIAGWDEGVASMKVGGKRQLVIPPELAYGDDGAGAVIPPGATLIFDVELLEIQP